MILTWCSGNTEDLRRAIFQSSGRRASLSDERPQARRIDVDALSPFVLKIPSFDPVHSSPLGTDAGEQPFEDANLEEPEQLFEDDDLDQPDILLTDSRIYQPVKVTRARNRVPRTLKRSRHGIPYPSLPPGVTKKIATTCIRALGSKKSSISKETLTAIMEASEQYFKQVSEDLGAFSQHAGRKRIDESDVIAIMKRYVKSPYMFDNE